MPRPEKQRCICPLSGERRFSTDGDAPALVIRADEVEALRLCDLEELSQQEAAARMGVSRGTLQRLLYSAHRQIAFALVCGRSIHLDPPNGKHCAPAVGCGKKCRFCRKNRKTTKRGGTNMIIAVTSANGEVFQHFGHTPGTPRNSPSTRRRTANCSAPASFRRGKKDTARWPTSSMPSGSKC